MEFSRIIESYPDGTASIVNWPIYFADPLKNCRGSNLPSICCAQIRLIDGKWCLLDINNRPIISSGVSQEDIEALYDIAAEITTLSYPWLKRFDYKVYWQIGLEAARILRKRKEHEAEQMRLQHHSTLYLNPDNCSVSSGQVREIHTVRSADEWLRIGRSEPQRKSLWLDIWFENEICFLFADTNIGKSIYAVQIGCHIAKEHKVIYFDYEMDARDFANRYFSPDKGVFPLPSNFRRSQPNRELFLGNEVENQIMIDIEKIIRREKPKAIIIDNITFITANSHNPKAALILMYKLKLLQDKYGLAILILAHTPKRNHHKPISGNDMDGSKKLLNFADSCFTIAQSMVHPEIQYLKQIKSRGGGIKHHSDNVLLMKRTFSNGWLHFESLDTDLEIHHLNVHPLVSKKALEKKVRELAQTTSLSQRDIAAILDTSPASVNRILKASSSPSAT